MTVHDVIVTPDIYNPDDTLVRLDVPPSDKSSYQNDSEEGRLFYMRCYENSDHNTDQSRYLLLRVVDPKEKLFEKIGVANARRQYV